VTTLEAQLVKERYERAVMEELLTTAYTTTIREILDSPPPDDPRMHEIPAAIGHAQCASPLGSRAASSSRLKYRLNRTAGS
jgi:hypothetical protein